MGWGSSWRAGSRRGRAPVPARARRRGARRARANSFRRIAEIMTIRCDIRRRADVRAAIDTVLERWASIDVLINNAGVIQVGPLEHMTTQDFENAMATHFWGPLHLMFEIVPSMRRRGFGRIVNISSIGGRVAVPHLAPVLREQVRAGRPLRRRARRTRTVTASGSRP